MAVTHKLYGPAMKNIIDGEMQVSSTGTFKVALMSSEFNFNQDNEDLSSVIENEIDDADYSTGGEELGITGSSYSNKVTTIKCAAETEFSTAGTISANYAVVYGSTNNKLVSCVDFGGEEASVDGEYKITWTDSKLFTVTVSA